MFDQLIIFVAQYLPFITAGVALWYILRLEISKRKSALVLLVLASAVAFVVDKILSSLISSPRPFVAQDIAPLFYHTADNGFPSEHVLFAMVIAGVLFAYNRVLGIILGILALFIGLARVIANVHHPIDIIGGAIIALISVFCAYRILSVQKVKDFLNAKSTK
jgi:undecaprenyl-diphosphatase